MCKQALVIQKKKKPGNQPGKKIGALKALLDKRHITGKNKAKEWKLWSDLQMEKKERSAFICNFHLFQAKVQVSLDSPITENKNTQYKSLKLLCSLDLSKIFGQ